MGKKQDTIYALSTPPGKSAIAVVRVSGSKAYQYVNEMSSSMPKLPNKSVLNILRTPTGSVIDQTITTYFKAPKSFTGEEMVEISMHGGNAIIKKFINIFKKNKNTRIAEPGEFTRRSFENNKLDLSQAEAIADLVNAETEMQRKQAYKELEGEVSSITKNIYNELKKVLANTEAIIDFTDEELPKNLIESIKEQTKNINKSINMILSSSKGVEKIRRGFVVAIIGNVNTGKSSFINNISKQEISIVTDEPGTTRDALESFIDLKGLPVRFFDTAGRRNSKNIIEKIGIDKSKMISNDADLNLVFVDKISEINEYTSVYNPIYIQSKIDIRKISPKDRNISYISSKTNTGIKPLLNKIYKKLINAFPIENKCISRERHRTCLIHSKKHLQKINKCNNVDIIAEDIRLALREISKIYGNVDIEDILDIIFSDFCIGK